MAADAPDRAKHTRRTRRGDRAARQQPAQPVPALFGVDESPVSWRCPTWPPLTAPHHLRGGADTMTSTDTAALTFGCGTTRRARINPARLTAWRAGPPMFYSQNGCSAEFLAAIAHDALTAAAITLPDGLHADCPLSSAAANRQR